MNARRFTAGLLACLTLAQIDLFSAYMQYQWACEGVLTTTGGM